MNQSRAKKIISSANEAFDLKAALDKIPKKVKSNPKLMDIINKKIDDIQKQSKNKDKDRMNLELKVALNFLITWANKFHKTTDGFRQGQIIDKMMNV